RGWRCRTPTSTSSPSTASPTCTSRTPIPTRARRISTPPPTRSGRRSAPCDRRVDAHALVVERHDEVAAGEAGRERRFLRRRPVHVLVVDDDAGDAPARGGGIRRGAEVEHGAPFCHQ